MGTGRTAATANVRGRRVRWHVAGAGSPLVVVHGLAGSARWWDPVLPPLVHRFTCHLVEIPRFGRSLRPQETAEWLNDWFDAAAVARADVVGHSLGGAAAARLAALRPDLVEKLVLVAPVGVPSARRAVGYVLPLAATLRAAAPRFVTRIAFDALRAGPDALLRGAFYAARADVRDEVRSISAPTLLVWGDRDVLVPRALADDWLAALPNGRLLVVGEAGHVPMVDRPRELAGALLEFLDEPRNVVGSSPVRGVRRTSDDSEAAAR